MKTMNLASVRNRFSQLADEVHECGEGVFVAQARIREVPLATADGKILPYPFVETIKC